MTRNWIAAASRRLRMVGSGSARVRRHHTALSLENLEHRLSLSSYSAGAVVGVQLNPQPLPPHELGGPNIIFVGGRPMLNPQPLPPHEQGGPNIIFVGGRPMLNPQPLPPHEAPMFKWDF